MTVGYQITGADVNNRAGSLVVALWTTLRDIKDFKAWLDDSAHSDTFLNGIGINGNVSLGDVKVLRDSFADLGGASGLYSVSHGTFAPGGASNYFFNAKNLSGVSFSG